MDPSAIKKIMGEVLPRLPIRVGRICIFNPPWFIGHIILPIAMVFMSKKLKSRLKVLNSSKPEVLHEYMPPTSLAADHGGSLPFDANEWSAKMIAAL
jgi:hypothetical protein